MAMRNSILFKHYAEQCRLLADAMPEHRTTLLDMALAWENCADAAENDPDENAIDQSTQ
jgi:hypothetical protein